jgi:hypothetical protein
VITHDFINITSLEVTHYGGGTVNLAFDNVIMDGTLPVELTSFTGTINNKNAVLNWQSATETDNYGFEVERITPPLNRLPEGDENGWEKIGFVPGNGNSNSPKEYSFTDNAISEPGTYKYRLKQLDINGQFEYSDIVELNLKSTTGFTLEQNFPNPFNPSTKIKYQLSKTGFVQLKVFNILGAEVDLLVNETQEEGDYSINFDAGSLPGGVYIYSLRVNDLIQNNKMVLVK